MFDFIVRLFGFRPYTNDYRVSDDYLYKMEEKELSQDIKQNKNNDELYLKRSKIYRKLKRYDLEIIDLKKAIQLNPDKRHVYSYLIYDSYEEQKNHEQAIKYIEDAITFSKTEKKDSHYWQRYIATLKKLNQKEAALDACNQAIELYPREPNLFILKAALLKAMGKNEESEKEFIKALHIQPYDLYIQSLAYQALGYECASKAVMKKSFFSIINTPNSITDQFNALGNADEVRALIRQDPWGVWAEYPRGSYYLDRLITGMITCKYSAELFDLASNLYDEWWR